MEDREKTRNLPLLICEEGQGVVGTQRQWIGATTTTPPVL